MLAPTVVTRTLPGGITVNTDTRTSSVTMIPFIRSRKVWFKIEGLLPNMRHRPYFDGVDVSTWCREETFLNQSDQPDQDWPGSELFTTHPDGSTDLVSDALGVIEGSFFIPNKAALKFRAGSREFKVLDYLASSDENSISKGYGAYSAQGMIETRVSTITTILPIPIIPPRQIDPVAQSFVVDSPLGAFVTAVDLFFATKSATVPVRIQIRTMENGTPTTTVVPGADLYKAASAVNVSVSAATATKFTFPAPVFLNGLVEYAIVVLAETDAYEVWTGVVTEFEVGSSSKRIMKQPSMGSFFKSQNGSTWTPDQSRDLKFKLYRANFGTSGTANFENVAVGKFRLGANPFSCTEIAATPAVVVRQRDHGLFAGSKITFAGVTAFAGITAPQMNTQHTVASVLSLDEYTIEVAGATSTSIDDGGGTVVNAQRHLSYNLMYPTINQLVQARTSIGWRAKRMTGTGPTGEATPYSLDGTGIPMAPNENNLYDSLYSVASQENETNALGGVKSLRWTGSFSSENGRLSPVIDLGRLSATLVANRIDNPAGAPAVGFNVPSTYLPETDPVGGSVGSKHLTVPVTLETPAIGLKVIFAANRPSESFIDLYYRVASVGSATPISEEDWVLATIDEAVRSDEDPDVMREYEYTIPSTGELEPFSGYQFKIVFRSTNPAKVPRIRDIRGIALAT